MAKPSINAKWATSGSALIADPGAGKRDTGWIVEIPPVEYFNWWMNNVGSWIEYLDTQVDAVLAIQGLYDAIIGVGGTHEDINAVVADMGVGLPATNVRAYHLGAAVPTITQVINKDGLEIEFHPKATFSKGAALVVGLQIDAKRCKIINGRFLNFNEVGGKAIDMTVNAKNCFIKDNSFDNNTAEIVDAGSNNVKTGNIVEVV